MTAKQPQGQLHLQTIALLKKSKLTLLELYDETGVKPDWIRSFKAGRMQHPSVNRVQALYEFLSGTTLSL